MASWLRRALLVSGTIWGGLGWGQVDFTWTRPAAQGVGNWANYGNWAGPSGQIPDDPDERAIFNDPSTNGMPRQNASMHYGLGQLRFNYVGWTVEAEDPLRMNSASFYQSVSIEARAQGGPGTITLYPAVELLNSRQVIATDSGAMLVLAGGVIGSYAPVISSLSPANPDTGAVLINTQSFVSDSFLVRQGTLLVAHSAALGTSGGAVVLGDTGTVSSARIALLAFTNGITVPKPIVVANHGSWAALGGVHTSGSSTFSSTVTLYRATELWALGDSTVTFSGPITGPGALTKTGTGTVVLSGSNTFSGSFTIREGTLRLGSSPSIPTGIAMQLASHPSVQFDLNGYSASLGYVNGGGQIALGLGYLTVASGEYSGPIFGAGGLIKTSDGTLTLAGTNSYTGGTSIQGGTLRLGSAFALPAVGIVTLANSAGVQLDLNGHPVVVGALTGGGALGGQILLGNSTLTISNGNFAGTIEGNGALIKAGPGTLELSGQNSYSGGTTITGGKLRIGSAQALPAGRNVTLASAADVVLDISPYSVQIHTLSGGGAAGGEIWATNAVLTVQEGLFAGRIRGGALVKTGAGSLTLAGVNSPENGVTISNGTLRLGASSALPDGVLLTLANTSGAQLDLAGYDLTVGTLQGGGDQGGHIALGGARLSVQTGNFHGRLTGDGELRKVGDGTCVLDADQDFTGRVTIYAGTLQLGSGGASGSVIANIENHGLLLIARSGTLELGQKITGSGSLKKTGSGTLVLSGPLSYTGETLLREGTLLIQSTTGPGRVAVSPSGAVSPRLGGNGMIGGRLEVDDNGIVAPGTSIGTLTVQSDATLRGTLEIELKQGQCDRLDVLQTLDIQDATLSFVQLGPLTTSVYVFASYGTLVGEFAAIKGLPSGMSVDYNYNGLNQIAVVPEPAVLLLWITGAVLLDRFRRLRRTSAENSDAS